MDQTVNRRLTHPQFAVLDLFPRIPKKLWSVRFPKGLAGAARPESVFRNAFRGHSQDGRRGRGGARAAAKRHLADRVDPDFERFIAGRRALLDARLAAIDAKAKGGLLPDVTLENGVLRITSIEKSAPSEAEALAARLYAMLSRIRITDLLSEVARWTLFTDCFTHLRSGETVTDPRVLWQACWPMASILA
jgi:hypothetical protein